MKDLNLSSSFSSIQNLPINLFPIDTDLLSLEIKNIYKFIIDGDPYPLYLTSQAIQRFLKIHPLYSSMTPVFVAKGTIAKRCQEYLENFDHLACDPPFIGLNGNNDEIEDGAIMDNMLGSNLGTNNNGTVSSITSVRSSSDNTTIDTNQNNNPNKLRNQFQVILLDRTIDLLSPLITQLTYQGLLDELYGITNGAIKLPSKYFDKNDNSKKITLHEDDAKNPFSAEESSAKLNPFEEDVTTDDFSADAQLKTIPLNAAKDEIYNEIRDRNFNAIGTFLSMKAKNLASQFDERHQVKTVSEVKAFVSKLPFLQNLRTQLANHTTIAERIKARVDLEDFRELIIAEQGRGRKICQWSKRLFFDMDGAKKPKAEETTKKENIYEIRLSWGQFLFSVDTDKINTYIDECICKHEDLTKILRLICLQSFVNNGLRAKVLDYYFEGIIQTYGYQHITICQNLRDACLVTAHLPESQNKRPYSALVKAYNLIVEKTDEKQPHDFSYVYSIYAPLSVRIVQKALKDIRNSVKQKDKTYKTNTDGKHSSSGSLTMDTTKGQLFSNIPDNLERNTTSSRLSDDHDTNSSIHSYNPNSIPGASNYQSSSLDGEDSNPLVSSAIGHQNFYLICMIGGLTSAEISALRFLLKITRKFTRLSYYNDGDSQWQKMD